ncbi:mannose-1-phosphate guanylyltransferase/mannose-6-phosphate isomerase [Burkholderia ubonensis]|uniref:mannose-1-phosphate guanylyltransferase/mannose-6-phosphate isomerase n=1 Tax=Burkholderia ubonensis TaxID=101571 RepID=UPI000A842C32
MKLPPEVNDLPMPIEPAADASVSGQVMAQPALRARAVVLAGGSGTRLWPVSRKHFPKQLVDVLGTGSLLQMTVGRLAPLSGEGGLLEEAPIVVCGAAHSVMSAKQLDELGVKARFIVEPSGRNTAPAMSLAAMHALAEGGDGVLVAMPADHMIGDTSEFERAVTAAVRFAECGAIVTLGIRPTRAETGFGYIEAGAVIDGTASEIWRFIEKPDVETAQAYVASGRYYWNSGVFVVRASVWLSLLRQMQPAMYAACAQAYELGEYADAFFMPHELSFDRMPADSIDYAVMENLARDSDVPGVVVPMESSWSDLGSWGAVWDALDKDSHGNASSGRVLMEDVHSCYVRSEKRLVTCIGVSNLVVVETADAVLVVGRSRAQDVKSVVDHISRRNDPEALSHRQVHRPWGHYDSIDNGERFQVKRILVQPLARLSLQLHHHRAEHWIVVRGTARVTRGDEVFLLAENQSTYIPLGVRHRLENPGKLPLELIEVQSGAYLGEDDIVRFEDVYGRVG